MKFRPSQLRLGERWDVIQQVHELFAARGDREAARPGGAPHHGWSDQTSVTGVSRGFGGGWSEKLLSCSRWCVAVVPCVRVYKSKLASSSSSWDVEVYTRARDNGDN